ncbi:MAG: hypothetical protein ABIL09_08940, partial [Gemmatimonadota bacterium]
MNTASDGFARIQGESRISANNWRELSSRLGLRADDVVDLWDQVCHPLMVASGAAPDIAFILQLRALRPHLDIDDFRDEVPAAVLSAGLLDALQDERLSGAKAKAAVLQLCRHVAAGSAGASSREFRRCLVVDLC